MASVSNFSETLTRLRQCTQVGIQTQWHYYPEDLPTTTALDSGQWQHWPIAALNAKDHLAWEKGRQVRWFSQSLTIPENLNGYPLEGLTLRLSLLWWAEQAQIFVNGQLVQEGDLFDCAPRIFLSPSVKPGETIDLALRFVSPGHDDGALMRSVCLYEVSSQPGEWVEPGFVADELAILEKYLTTFAPDQSPKLAESLSRIDWSALADRDRFDASLSRLRQHLEPLARGIKQRQIALLGHAHLDMAWLWPVSETWDAAERTFKSVLSLQQDFPDLIFCHSSPALYAWIEENRPELFARIQQQVAAGRWEVIGGMWVEPDLNLIQGESIVRQILYGQRYYQQKFGRTSSIAWLPDTFGFTWQLPQLLKQGGIEYFVTQKLRWNDTTKYPHEVFWWIAPDGTRVLALMSAPIGEGIDPVKMATYAWEWEQKTGTSQSLWLPGVGDHGGGPTRDMLEIGRRWARSPFFPEMAFMTAEQYLLDRKRELVEGQETGKPGDQGTKGYEETGIALTDRVESSTLPTWNTELYLEFHRGCYTTHADQKQKNRDSEGLLYQAELWASLATIAAGFSYPKQELETAWKHTLFNQFHDILPGSSIPEVFEEADRLWTEVQQRGEVILCCAQEQIANAIQLPAPPHPQARPIVVFNSLNWQRSEVVSLPIAEGQAHWQILDLEGQPVACQWREADQTILFWADAVPSVGYRLFWLCPSEVPLPTSSDWDAIEVLENECLRVEVDSVTGDLARVFDKVNQREVLRDRGNQLQAFRDEGQYWDAWNIDPAYAEHPLPPSTLKPQIVLESGPLQTRLRVTRSIGQSTIQQDYILQKGSPVLQIETDVDWQESHVLLKAAFPVTLTADVATYEIPFGAIERTTRPETPAEKALWEVPALRWADLSDGTYGVSLLNHAKYGYDAQPHQLRLTLLRRPTWPDPQADLGRHHFTYALYPHAADWRSAHTVRRGYELSQPLTAVIGSSTDSPGVLPAVASLVNLGADSLVLSTLKQAEDDSERWILRCYESQGKPAQLHLLSDVGLELEQPVDLLEQPILEQPASVVGQSTTISPWRVASFQVTHCAGSRSVISTPPPSLTSLE